VTTRPKIGQWVRVLYSPAISGPDDPWIGQVVLADQDDYPVGAWKVLRPGARQPYWVTDWEPATPEEVASLQLDATFGTNGL
jgi:hypothetical protein